MLVNIHRDKQINAVIKVNLIRCFYLFALERHRTDGQTVEVFYGFDLAAASKGN